MVASLDWRVKDNLGWHRGHKRFQVRSNSSSVQHKDVMFPDRELRVSSPPRGVRSAHRHHSFQSLMSAFRNRSHFTEVHWTLLLPRSQYCPFGHTSFTFSAA
jgi:hypothetical protein